MKRNLIAAIILGWSSLMPWIQILAQTNAEVADVPFPFLAADRMLPAGKYMVSKVSTGPVFALQNEKGASLLVQLGAQSTVRSEQPSLTFACKPGQQECVLAKIAPSNSSLAYGLSSLNSRPQKLHMVTMVNVKLTAH